MIKKDTNNNGINQMSATIEDSQGRIHYRIEGNYYEKLYLINENTGEKTTVFETPKFQRIEQDESQIYGMNYVAL